MHSTTEETKSPSSQNSEYSIYDYKTRMGCVKSKKSNPTMSLSYEQGLKDAVNNTPVSIKKHVQYISLDSNIFSYYFRKEPKKLV